ncbi:hypothetical protein FACS189491_03440 [Spirochaetia bacterium]|nr:hypothetical protein FACS189491_03440 [Spirochaetia bacterium]
MVVSEADRIMLVRLLQPPKALYPMLVTVSGSLTELRLSQCQNAEAPMVTSVLGKVRW